VPEIVRSIQKSHPNVDPDYIQASISQEINKYIDELAFKANSTLMLILEYVISGRIKALRQFEERFADLLERTLMQRHGMAAILQALSQVLAEQISKAENDSGQTLQ